MHIFYKRSFWAENIWIKSEVCLKIPICCAAATKMILFADIDCYEFK